MVLDPAIRADPIKLILRPAAVLIGDLAGLLHDLIDQHNHIIGHDLAVLLHLLHLPAEVVGAEGEDVLLEGDAVHVAVEVLRLADDGRDGLGFGVGGEAGEEAGCERVAEGSELACQM